MTELPCACPATDFQAMGASGLYWVAVLKRDPHAPGSPNTMGCPAACREELHSKARVMLEKLKDKAKDLGFIACGFSKPERPFYFDEFRAWIADHKNADMSWLERNLEVREDPTRLLEGCRTIISLAYPYTPLKPATPEGFTVSRYAQPSKEDYHQRLRRLCGELRGTIEEVHPESQNRICVDSAPILEKSFAWSSGIGFVGKNNMLIIPGYGSYFHLTEILTTALADFPQVEPLGNQCGSCTQCLESCPTGALEEAFRLEASKCLSYLTIEFKGFVNGEQGRKMDNCFFGCDRCQEACPFNKGEDAREEILPPVNEILDMKDEEFRKRFGKTALARAGLEKLKSNIRAMGT